MVLCLTLGGLWVRSYLYADKLDYSTGDGSGVWHVVATTVRGKCVLSWGDVIGFPLGWRYDSFARPTPAGYDIVGNGPMEHLWGVEVYRGMWSAGHTSVWVPLWLPMTLTAILPGLWVYRRFRRKGAGSGREVGRGFPVGAASPTGKAPMP